MHQQLNIELKTKEEEAIEFIKKHEPPEGYGVSFSGGKDSIVLYDLAKKSGVKFQAFYARTGIDPPELVKFIEKEYPNVKHLKPNDSFFHLIPIHGWPSISRRWC
jgi:phosphoadenosine phosphosulfate reductase